MQCELIPDLIRVGDRVIELEGKPSQRCGVVVAFRAERNHPGVNYPVVCWDSGHRSFSSGDLGLRRLADIEQLKLF